MSLRDYFLLEYAELLQNSPEARPLWRMTCDYLAAAGDEGRNSLRQFVLHVGLGLDTRGQVKDVQASQTPKVNGDQMDVETSDDEDRLRHFTDVREACEELRLEEEWRTISRTMADRLIRTGEYGMAAAMCLQAEDSFTLSLIAERICDAYLSQGEFQQSRACRHHLTSYRRGRVPSLDRDITAQFAE